MYRLLPLKNGKAAAVIAGSAAASDYLPFLEGLFREEPQHAVYLLPIIFDGWNWCRGQRSCGYAICLLSGLLVIIANAEQK